MKSLALALATLILPPLLAQQQPPASQSAPVPRVQKIFAVKYADVNRLAKAFEVFGTVRADAALRIITVDATPAAIATIDDALKQLDVPPQPEKSVKPAPMNIELTFQVLFAGTRAEGKPKLTPDLDGVARNLTALFGYKALGLLETAQLRAREGNMNYSVLTGYAAWSESQPSPYRIECRPSLSVSDTGYVVHLDSLQFMLDVPGTETDAKGNKIASRASLQTNIDIRDGQKVVVGKTSTSGLDGAIILVVSAKVVE